MPKYSAIWYSSLLLASLIGTNFNVAPGISWADFLNAFLALICIWKLGVKKWEGDLLSNFTLVYIIILIFSSVLNLTYNKTQFVNYLRIFTCGWIVYIVVRNSLYTKEGLRIFSIMFIFYSIFFLMYSRDILFQSMSEAHSFHTLDFGYGRNNWGFTNLLHLIFISFLLYKVKLPKYIKILAYCQFPFLAFNIYFSASRFALITLVGFIVFFRFWMNKRVSLKEGIALGLLMLIAPFLIMNLEATIDSNFLEGSKHVFESKIDNTEDEVMSGRLYGLNIEPIENYVSNPLTGIEGILIGDGLSITHGVLSHTFIATGLIGFVYFFIYNLYLILYYFRKNRIGIFIAAVLIIMLVNDIMTNARFIIYINNLLFMIILAFLVNRLKINENDIISS